MFIGLAAAPALAYALFMIFITARYGKKDCPLLLSKVPGDDYSFLFHLSVEPEQIIDLQKKVEALLVENNVDRRTVGKIKLLIEELYMLIREKNEQKPVLSEMTVFLHPEEIKIITKDDGVLFAISEEDVSVTSSALCRLRLYGKSWFRKPASPDHHELQPECIRYKNHIRLKGDQTMILLTDSFWKYCLFRQF